MADTVARNRLTHRLRLLSWRLGLPSRRGGEITAALRWLGVQHRAWRISDTLDALAKLGCPPGVALDESLVLYSAWLDTLALRIS